MSDTAQHPVPGVNVYPNGTKSIQFTLPDGRNGTLGTFPKGLNTSFPVTEKETLRIVSGKPIIDGRIIPNGSVLTFDPKLFPKKRKRQFTIQCPDSDVAYVSEFG